MKVSNLLQAGLLAFTVSSATACDVSQLSALANQKVPYGTRLTGRFIYKGSIQGLQMFCTEDGRLLLHIQFWGRKPAGLVPLTAISPDAHEPLTVLSVTRSRDDAFIFVEAVSKPGRHP